MSIDHKEAGDFEMTFLYPDTPNRSHKPRRGFICGDADKEEAQFNSKLAYIEPILESGLQVGV